MLSREARVQSNANLFGDYFLMEVEARDIGRKAAPGQFYMLKVGGGTDPLLRRPLGLHRIVSPNSIKFLYRAIGYGTRMFARMVPGDTISVLGPLGKGYPVGKEVKHALIVAGGIGVAPLMALVEHIVSKRPEVSVACFIGGRSRDDVLGVHEFRRLGVKTYVSTEDGSVPRKGLITHSLEEYINKYARHGMRGWAIYSCGPKPMIMGVAALARMHGIKNYASLEANMACGVGACVGCVIGVLDEEHGATVYKKVCQDGPVFDVDKVVWG